MGQKEQEREKERSSIDDGPKLISQQSIFQPEEVIKKSLPSGFEGGFETSGPECPAKIEKQVPVGEKERSEAKPSETKSTEK